MDTAKLGKRYRCYACDTLFYDLNKEAAICPKCQADQSNAPKPERKIQEVAEEASPDVEEIGDYEEDFTEKTKDKK